ncbi:MULTISPECIES: SHOCT domain-containing protein [Amycolatopsis]|uniref:SHOCT domain-containing protein n=1 Tax=Amycolatopsis TaxID=1813 RepID=UPI00106E7E71|nr:MULTISPECIES: SHOCT domain-containing protein [Amycolatopsis]
MMYWHYGTAAEWVGPVVMSIVAVALLAAIAVVTALLVRRPSGSVPDADPATAILRQRFARGEIDQDEYDRRREALRH